MGKKIILMLMLCCSVCAKAQWSVGLMAGYDRNVYTYEKGYAYDLRFGNRSGWELTVPVQYNFNDWLGVRADLSYVQKGHKQHRTGYATGMEYKTRDHYLQVPLMASFSFGGSKVRGWFNPGGYMGYWLSSYWEGVTAMPTSPNGVSNSISSDPDIAYHFKEKVKFMSDRDNRLDAGLTAVVGVGWKFHPNLEARMEGVCWYSLVDRASGDSHNVAPRYDTTYSIRLGITYFFDKKKK
jgi:hypothetical protein